MGQVRELLTEIDGYWNLHLQFIADKRVIGQLELAEWNTATPSICGVYVIEQGRRQGIAAALLTAAIKWARGSGKESVGLLVTKGNKAAIALYEAHGMKQYDEDEKHYHYGINFSWPPDEPEEEPEPPKKRRKIGYHTPDSRT